MKNSDETLNEKQKRAENIQINLNKIFCDYGKTVFFHPDDKEIIAIYRCAIENMINILAELEE